MSPFPYANNCSNIIEKLCSNVDVIKKKKKTFYKYIL